MSEYDGFAYVMAGMFGFIAFIFIICIALYIITAVWEMKFLQAAGYQNTWMAWIPICNIWALADVAFGNAPKAKLEIIKKPIPTTLFKIYPLVISLVSFVLGMIPIINFVAGIASMVLSVAFFMTILKAIVRKFNAPVTDGRIILDSWITIIGFYDLAKWSKMYPFNPYADISDIAGDFGTGYAQGYNYPQGQQMGYPQQMNYQQGQQMGYPQQMNYQQGQQMNYQQGQQMGYPQGQQMNYQQPQQMNYQQPQQMNYQQPQQMNYQQPQQMNYQQPQQMNYQQPQQPTQGFEAQNFESPVQGFDETVTPSQNNDFAQAFESDNNSTNDIF